MYIVSGEKDDTWCQVRKITLVSYGQDYTWCQVRKITCGVRLARSHVVSCEKDDMWCQVGKITCGVRWDRWHVVSGGQRHCCWFMLPSKKKCFSHSPFSYPIETPAHQLVTPVHQSVTPAHQLVTPVHQLVTPVQQGNCNKFRRNAPIVDCPFIGLSMENFHFQGDSWRIKM